MTGDGGAAEAAAACGLAPPASVHVRTGAPVCDPELPPLFRTWAAGQRPVFSARGTLLALIPGGSSARVPAAAGCWLLAAACMILLVIGPVPVSPAAWLVGAFAAAMAATAIRQRARRRDLRLCRSHVIFPENLDEACRELFHRSQDAITAIIGSQARAAGILEHPVPDGLLRQDEWEIACQLREITSLRTLIVQRSPAATAGPMTTDVLGAQQQAINIARHAAVTRITALEHYARQIAAADNANRDWHQSTELSKLNPRYLDLVARTASDQYAATEITSLTDQLAAATRTRTARLREADLAADVLELPATASRNDPTA